MDFISKQITLDHWWETKHQYINNFNWFNYSTINWVYGRKIDSKWKRIWKLRNKCTEEMKIKLHCFGNSKETQYTYK